MVSVNSEMDQTKLHMYRLLEWTENGRYHNPTIMFKKNDIDMFLHRNKKSLEQFDEKKTILLQFTNLQ